MYNDNKIKVLSNKNILISNIFTIIIIVFALSEYVNAIKKNQKNSAAVGAVIIFL